MLAALLFLVAHAVNSHVDVIKAVDKTGQTPTITVIPLDKFTISYLT
jgi:hypothetical protein